MQAATTSCWPCPVVVMAPVVGRGSGLADRPPSPGFRANRRGFSHPAVRIQAVPANHARRATGRASERVAGPDAVGGWMAGGVLTAQWTARFQAPRQGSHSLFPGPSPGQGTLGARRRPLSFFPTVALLEQKGMRLKSVWFVDPQRRTATVSEQKDGACRSRRKTAAAPARPSPPGIRHPTNASTTTTPSLPLPKPNLNLMPTASLFVRGRPPLP
jgi:hypothetical protein